ncbi:alpha/beta fold hydrolase [Polyangium aurulentum]|uniref:alpha/beta fold hydrolase n=1 Tax=Polyangium aurulentum TaxID=2567896 RepID=UPI0010AE03F5|nr:alpha/beta hydrolase [Polyangium aurulentum]UQA56463.1 alpha/beta hydrolase [Polyangium aurulentum]
MAPKQAEPPRPIERVIRDVTARGVRMRVLEAGSGPALLLVHGFMVSHREFEDVIDAFARRFHVIAPDLPGFGESEKPSPTRYPYGIEAFAESMADLIAAFGVGRASVLGHSMGAGVALTLAAEHPELVTRLVVEDALCYPFPLSFKARLPLIPILGGVIFKQLYGRAMFRAYFRDDVFRPGAELPMARIDQHYDFFNAPESRESAYAILRAMMDTRPIVARVTRITTPTLVVWGREDKLFPAASAQRLAREIHGAKLEIMNAGHSPHEERPREFVSLVTQFLEGMR